MTPAEPWQWALVVFSFGLCYLFVGLGRGWLMRAIQLTIILAVMGSNVQWHWTPSPVVPGLFGIAAAWLVTVPPLKLYLWWSLRRRRQGGGTARLEGRATGEDAPKQHRF